MLKLFTSSGCCGLREISGLEDYTKPEKLMNDFCELFSGNKAAFVMFSCPLTQSIGRRFVEFIRANDLGDVTESAPHYSKSTNRNVRVYVWGVNKPVMEAWYRKNLIPIEVGQKAISRNYSSMYLGIVPGTEVEVVAVSDDGMTFDGSAKLTTFRRLPRGQFTFV